MGWITGDRKEAILERLQSIVPPAVFQTHRHLLDFDDAGEGCVEIPVPNDFYRQWVERELKEPIEAAFRQVLGVVPSINFTIRASVPPTFKSPVAAPALPVRARPEEPASPRPFSLMSDYTFDRFIVGPSNRMAHAAALSVSENPGRSYNPLFIHGGSGLGKTHLLQAICSAVLQRSPKTRILYVTCEGFVNDYVRAMMKHSPDAFRSKYRNADILLVDDIHFLAGKGGSQEEFFHTFDAIRNAAGQLIFSSDAAPKHIPTLEQRLTSRFEWGFVARIDPPTFEMRLAILRRQCQERGHSIADDVLTYLASQVESNIRELEGSLNKILASAALTQRRVDLDLAKEALSDLGSTPPSVLTPEEIIQAVSKHYGKKISDFRTRRWTKSTSLARHVAIYLCKHLTSLSLLEIGKSFGGKDHSSVIYAIKRIDAAIQADPDFALSLERLTKSIRPL